MSQQLRLAPALLLAVAAAPSLLAQNYTQVNLVANTAAAGAAVTDPNLIDPWGLSRSSSSPWWVADAGSGVSTLYNGAGAITPLVVAIPKNPSNTKATAGSPTGTVYNGIKTDFLVSQGEPASFLFSTLDGTIAGWNSNVGIVKGAKAPSLTAITKAVGVAGSVYTGLTSATLNGATYLYAPNFGKGTIDVYDSIFHPVRLPQVSNGDPFNPGTEAPFFDALLPAGYAPYNAQAIGDNIVVTYAPTNFTAGPGNGYVDIYSSAGELLKRLQWGNWFNAPWGIALAPTDFGTYSHTLLIGNFGFGGSTPGSGTIASFDLVTGNYLGQIENSTGAPIVIDGLWALATGNGASAGSSDPAGAPGAELYFTAGPDGGKGGLLGYLKPVSTELVDGNNQ